MTTFGISKKLVALKYRYEKRQPSKNHVEIMYAF